MSDATAAPTVEAARRLTVYYVCALSLVALLSLAGQFLIQRQLTRQRDDSKVVNLAGRQRMLGQRACKCAALLADANPTVDHARYRDELITLLPVWSRNHRGLQQGDAELGLPGDASTTVAAVFLRLNPTFDSLHAAAQRVLQARDENEVRTAATAMLTYEADYLQGMDEIVSQYEGEGRQRVARLQTVEQLLLCLTLLVLLLEGAFVFRPAVRRIRESLIALRRAGDELRVAKEAAEAANRTKSLFLANMSHELRTPLHAVLGAAELLRKSDSMVGRGDFLETIENSSRTLLCLLNDLLDLSRIEAGKLELHPAPFGLREFVSRTTSMFRAAAQAKGITLRIETNEAIPGVVTADQLRLQQVLANLLSNAIKFSDAGTVALRIIPATTADGLCFEVSDEGLGIPAADQARIFESFTQLHAETDRSHAGAGLGLAISAQLVALMGGRLEVRSEPGRGSTFSFSILCGAADSTCLQPEAPPHSQPAIPSLRILAADDAPAGRRVLEELLAAEGHRTRCVADGREVVTAFETEAFDLVLLDLRMPEVDGATAAAAIRSYEREHGRKRTPIVAVTADAMSPEGATDALADFDGYVTKPFSGEALRRTVASCARWQSNAESAAPPAHVAPATTLGDDTESRVARILIRLQGRRELLDELAELFLSEAPRLLIEIHEACEDRDPRRLRTAVHRLRGQLEMFEIREAAVVAHRIEQACEQGEIEPIAEDLMILTQSWPTLCDEIGTLRSS